MKIPTQTLKLGGGGGGGGRNPAIRALAALTLIAAVAALILHAAIPAGAQSTTDYDSDDNGLIEISTLDQLNAIRWDLDGNGIPAAANTTTYAAAFPNHDTSTSTPMGCPAACEGYELAQNLDFAADGVAVTSTDPYPNWTPIGGSYAAVFDGKGHTITRLTITSVGGHVGLFGVLASNGVIRDVGMITPNVSGGLIAGALAGEIVPGAEITASYVQGGSVAVPVSRWGGGLVGSNGGTIRASYSTASVTGGGSFTRVGGLVGQNNGGIIIAGYAAGAVTGGSGSSVGGLVGRSSGSSAVITDSYCDATVHGTSTCIGAHFSGSTATAAGYTTAELQTPTGYTGIFANWNVDVDGDAFPDNPWNFGATSTYPTLKTPTQRQAAAAIDYDSDDDNLIDVDSVYKLNAIRHDLNGDGLPDAVGNYPAYAGAFPDGDLASTSTRMGCAATCIGYELTGNLDFDADGMGGVTSTDPYPDWTPIGGSYGAVFDGRGFTISNLTIAGATGNSGLFDTLGSGGVIRDVGMVDASIGNDGADAYAGALAGDNDGGMIITSYAAGGAVTVTGTSTYGGGLIGRNAGDVRAVYSTAAVNASSTATSTIGGLIGLHAGSVTASYAAGTTTGSGAAVVGGFAGQASSTAAAITNSYCDTTVNGTSTPCVAAHAAGATATSTGYTTTQLQTPTGYTGIYAGWNIPLGADNMLDDPWDFGTGSQYPTIKPVASRMRTAPPAATTATTTAAAGSDSLSDAGADSRSNPGSDSRPNSRSNPRPNPGSDS